MTDPNEQSKRDLLAVWHAKCGDHAMPARADFDVIGDLLPFLGSLILVQAIDDGRDWRFRVFGTKVATLIGEDNQERRLSEIAHGHARRVRSIFSRVIGSGKPTEFFHSAGELMFAPRSEGIALPLSNDGKTVNSILLLVLPARQTVEPA